jgi:tyrosyl-tRNA synthetase
MIKGGGVSLNKEKIPNAEKLIVLDDLINYRYLLFQKGKKNYFLIIAE